ncbi:MAG: hypothetical protein OXU74_01165 [Gemmatimonadota bacterium]|nr:hypothetical protein [Gemmatimonadota bacterium]
MPETRRSFLKQSVATVAAVSATGCAPDGESSRRTGDLSADDPGAGPAPLPAPTLRAVAEAVLPEELGAEGRERAVTAFERWSDGLEPVAELSHPYLVPETRYSGPDPRPGWAAQLQGLEKECRARHGTNLADLDVAGRRQLLARGVGQAGPGLGSAANANHIAVALMAHFFASPVATDMCYRRTIAKQQCRGLEGAPAEPEVLAARTNGAPSEGRRGALTIATGAAP